MSTNERQWHAVYTLPRCEKKVHKFLTRDGIESYCPLNVVYRKWSDRMKRVEEPLFRSYVFVFINPQEHAQVRMTDGVLNFVYWLKKPAIIKPEEIETIRRFMNEYEDVEAVSLQDTELKAGSQVTITGGVLLGKDAIALRVDKKMVEVRIESIGFKLIAKVDRKKVMFKSNPAPKSGSGTGK